MAGKVLTYSELFDIISSCVPDYTANYSSFCYQFYGSNTDITTNKCAVKISSTSQLEQAFSEVIPSIDRYITSNPTVSSLTSNIAANKLFPAEEFTVDPRNKYYGCKIANNNAVNIITTGATITNEDTATISVRLYKSSDTTPMGTTSVEALSYTMSSFTETTQAQSPNVGKIVLMEEGIKVAVCIQFPNKISSISNAKVSLVDSSGTIIRLTGAKQNDNYVYFTSTATLTISLLKRLKNVSSLQFTGTYTLEPKLIYTFDLTKNQTIYGTQSLKTTPLLVSGTTLQNYPMEFAVTVYGGDFRSKIWVDNANRTVYSNGKISIPASSGIHQELLNAAKESDNEFCYIRVTLRSSSGYNVVLYYSIRKTGSATGQTYNTGSDYPVFIDVSNSSNAADIYITTQGMKGILDIYTPKVYAAPNSSGVYVTHQNTNYHTLSPATYHTLARESVPNPHYLYFKQNTAGNYLYVDNNKQYISQTNLIVPLYMTGDYGSASDIVSYARRLSMGVIAYKVGI